MRITLKRECNVRLPKGSTLTVPDKEAERLIKFGLAQKTTTKRKTKKENEG